MIRMKRYVFDLDNTLIYTDLLNNISYNYALNLLGLSKIENFKRITKQIVFEKYAHLDNEIINKIIEIKKKHYIDNLDCTRPNQLLINFLKEQNNEHCILWTSAEEWRVLAILEYYNIKSKFKKIIFSEKTMV